MYRKVILAALLLLIAASVAFAEDRCTNCNMKLEPGSRSTVTFKMTDGPERRFCSLYCASRAKEREGGSISGITVQDYLTGETLAADSAAWVQGSDAPEPMGEKSHVPFKDKKSAAAFAKKHGGKVVSFKQAYRDAVREWKH
jgi:nitrous oxide reductase accessory protein NosL